MYSDLPLSCCLCIHLRYRSVVSNKEQVAGSEKTFREQDVQLGFGIEWMLSRQPYHSRVTEYPAIWGSPSNSVRRSHSEVDSTYISCGSTCLTASSFGTAGKASSIVRGLVPISGNCEIANEGGRNGAGSWIGGLYEKNEGDVDRSF